MTAEGTFPKSNGDVLYASEVNNFQNFITKTKYLSIHPSAFVPSRILEGNTGNDMAWGTTTADYSGASESLYAPVFLPNGAVVSNVILWGSDATNTWSLDRLELGTANITNMAGANVNSADSSITTATIDNNTYAYVISAGTGDGDTVKGARIIYTETV